MELVIIIIIVLAICFILNVSPYYMMMGGGILLFIMTTLFAIGFVFATAVLLFSKRKEAKFVRTGAVKDSKFQVAYYLVEGEEYPCMFPKEGILEEKLYQKEKACHVMWNQRLGKVFDRFAMTTCVLGLVFSLLLSVGLGILVLCPVL